MTHHNFYANSSAHMILYMAIKLLLFTFSTSPTEVTILGLIARKKKDPNSPAASFFIFLEELVNLQHHADVLDIRTISTSSSHVFIYLVSKEIHQCFIFLWWLTDRVLSAGSNRLP